MFQTHIQLAPMASVTILMPVYNAEKYVSQAIESILTQSYSDFIFLIINDGSVDDSEKIILSFKDKRIQYLRNEQNIGLVATLNKGIELTETEYLARMDADDIAFHERLEEQVNYLKQHPEIGVCGTLYEKLGDKSGVAFLYLDHDDIVSNLLFSNGICHPSVIIRTKLLKDNAIRFGVDFDYNDGYGHKLLELEDYALWHKLKHYTRFANLNEVLLKYRREGQNLSAQNMEAILKRRKKFISFWLKELDIEAEERALDTHCSYHAIKDREDISALKVHFEAMLKANNIKKIYPQDAFEKAVTKQWERFFILHPQWG